LHFKGCAPLKDGSTVLDDGGVLNILIGGRGKTMLPTITVENCVFESPRAGVGAAIYAEGPERMVHKKKRTIEETFAITPILRLHNSTIASGLARNAGAIYMKKFAIAITSSLLTGCKANGRADGEARGGAILMYDSTITMEDTTITFNQAETGATLFGDGALCTARSSFCLSSTALMTGLDGCFAQV
jgi:hypothetical protein